MLILKEASIGKPCIQLIFPHSYLTKLGKLYRQGVRSIFKKLYEKYSKDYADESEYPLQLIEDTGLERMWIRYSSIDNLVLLTRFNESQFFTGNNLGLRPIEVTSSVLMIGGDYPVGNKKQSGNIDSRLLSFIRHEKINNNVSFILWKQYVGTVRKQVLSRVDCSGLIRSLKNADQTIINKIFVEITSSYTMNFLKNRV